MESSNRIISSQSSNLIEHSPAFKKIEYSINDDNDHETSNKFNESIDNHKSVKYLKNFLISLLPIRLKFCYNSQLVMMKHIFCLFVLYFNLAKDSENQKEDENIIDIQFIKNEKKDNRFLGVCCIIASAFCFSMMTFLCKLAYQDNSALNGFDYLLLRSSSMAPLSILQVIYLKVNVLNIKKEERIMLLVRCLAGGIGMPIFFIGLKYIPASVGSLIYNINPILVSAFAFLCLSEQFTIMKIFAVIGSFIGVVVFLSGQHTTSRESKKFLFGIICSSIYCICATIQNYIPY